MMGFTAAKSTFRYSLSTVTRQLGREPAKQIQDDVRAALQACFVLQAVTFSLLGEEHYPVLLLGETM